jgi:flagellar biosynthetic protein FlhB
MAAGGALLVAFAPLLSGWLRDLLAGGLTFDARSVAAPEAMTERLALLGWKMVAVVLPLGLALALVAAAAGVLAGGWNWTTKPLHPRFDKFDPFTGMGRLFSRQQLAETMKACFLALVLGAIGALWLRSHASDFAETLALPLPAALAHGGQTIKAGLVLLVLALAAFALVDVPLQRKRLLDRLMMTYQELREEQRQLEGNVEIKSKVRARMREIVKRRMLAAVPRADLVVMNPTHFAVALRYDEATMAAPRVVAKGADLLALRIRDIAREAKVPVLQAPPLARALYAHAEIDQEVPPALFAAVAQVLAWVYQLRAALAGRGAMPAELPPLPVPAELDPHRKQQEADA